MSKLVVTALLAAFVAAPILGQDVTPDPSSVAEAPADSNVEGNPEVIKLITDCDARKFETTVEREENGEKKNSKVKLCGKPGQTDAEWAATLKDAATKIEMNPKMPQATKDQLGAALQAEIAKVEAGIDVPTAAVVAAEPPAPESIRPAGPDGASVPSVAVATKKPMLTIRCLAPGESGGGSSCGRLERSTRLSILAENDLTNGASLRFLRRGDERARLALAPMRQGETYRSKLPPELCAGISSTKIEIQVMGSGQIVASLGPFLLRC